ncbi:hypothetical protein H5U35_05840 [Candidatus Aerophobetes bacterium]|nr:hypothetical protein [Candidatus Aerophobetes bacterium]
MEKIAVLGAGAMGTAVAFHLSRIGHEVDLWGTDLDEEVVRTRRQVKLGVKIPERIRLLSFDQIEETLKGKKVVIFCISSQGIGRVAEYVAGYLNPGMVIVNIGKGIPEPPCFTLCQLIESKISCPEVQVVAMGGPARAIEIIRGVITQVIFAFPNPEVSRLCCKIFEGPTFKTSFTLDRVGVELCAATKNAYAIAIGIVDELRREDNNFKAALMSSAIEEMAEFVSGKGGKIETVLGPAGVGDLYVTCQAGRNKSFAQLLARGLSPQEALARLKGETIEGYWVIKGMWRIAKELEREKKISSIRDELPLFYLLYQILYQKKPADWIFTRYKKPEKVQYESSKILQQ